MAQGPALFASLIGLAKKELRKIQNKSRDPRSQVGGDSRKESQRPVTLLNPGLRFPSTVFSSSVIICCLSRDPGHRGKDFPPWGWSVGSSGERWVGLWLAWLPWAAGNLDQVMGMQWGRGTLALGGRGTCGTPWVRPGPLPFPALRLSWSLAVQGALGACIWGEAQGGVPCGLGCWEGLLSAPLNPCGVLGGFLSWVGCTGRGGALGQRFT